MSTQCHHYVYMMHNDAHTHTHTHNTHTHTQSKFSGNLSGCQIMASCGHRVSIMSTPMGTFQSLQFKYNIVFLNANTMLLAGTGVNFPFCFKYFLVA